MNRSTIAAVAGRLPSLGTLVVALLAGTAGVAGSYAVVGFRPSFVVGPIAGAMARLLPGQVITFAIVVLGDVGTKLNIVTAAGVAVGLFSAVTLASVALGRRLGNRVVPPVAAAVGGSAVAAGLTTAPAPSAVAGLAMGVVVGAAEFLSGVDGVAGVSHERRRVLGGTATAIGLSLGGVVLGRQGGFLGTAVEADLGVEQSVATEIDSLLGEADEKSLGVEGIDPLVSDGFYEVDINATDPDIDESEWTLTVTGAVEETVSYDYDDIRAMDAENRFSSLRCVGEQLNGEKLDNALWTGVPIMDIVDPAVPAEECCVMLRAADGFYEEFPLAALDGGFLAFGMNGSVLPRGHGYPVRALIPGHWGEINVKWITEIEVLEEEQDGYWEERGWHGTGPVNTVAKLHAVEDTDDGGKRVAGHAHAGTRGIDRVEVSTDGGESWNDATLSEPLPGEDVWRQWTYSYDPPGGEHEVIVRATDGTGTLQPEEEESPFPSGPSGWVSRVVQS